MSSDLIITLIFAAIAVFVILKLRSVLGTKTGEEKPFDTMRPPPREPAKDANVVSFPGARSDKKDAETGPVDPVVAKIRGWDGDFEPNAFLGGAKAAFELIVAAFAKGDSAALKPLLDDKVFAGFDADIRDRQAAGLTRETTLVRFVDARLERAEHRGNIVDVTVRFVTEQVSVTKDKSGAVVEGDPKRSEALTDLWTFTRDRTWRHPNWLLSDTDSAD
jgi:predicted lipid-binding transport protein (Tim44 family)